MSAIVLETCACIVSEICRLSAYKLRFSFHSVVGFSNEVANA